MTCGGAIQFLDYLLERLPFRVEVVQTDNGVEFQSSFHWQVLDRGIGHVYIKLHTPRLNGKVERSHRIDAHHGLHQNDGDGYPPGAQGVPDELSRGRMAETSRWRARIRP